MFDGICYLIYSHSSSCMNVQGELLFCRGDHLSPADACGSGKPSGRIWNPPLRVEKPPSAREVPRRGGGENLAIARNISGSHTVLSPTACGRSPLAEGAKGEHTFFDSLKPFSG